MRLLHIDSAITGDQSVSRALSADIVARIRTWQPDIDLVRRDLFESPLDHLTLPDLPAAGGSSKVLEEFLTSDIVVVGAPMYNFSIPSQLKAWIDRILIAGQTFRYDDSGPVGLAGDKKVFIALARGNDYRAGKPAERDEHAETYLRTVFRFIGVTPEFIIAEGMLLGAEERAAAMGRAEADLARLERSGLLSGSV